MKLATKTALSWMLALMLVFAFIPAALAKPFASETITDVNKSWKIHFSQSVNQTYLSDSYIYILDGSKKIKTSYKPLNNGRTVEVIPAAPYETGKVYKLEVADTIRSTSNKLLTEKATKTFEVINTASVFQSVDVTSSSGLHHFKIKATKDVASIRIQGLEMHLTGWNEFTFSFNNLKSGTNATIRAYDSNGKTLETKTYPVD